MRTAAARGGRDRSPWLRTQMARSPRGKAELSPKALQAAAHRTPRVAESRPDALLRQRQVANSPARGIRDRVCDRAGGRSLPALAAAEEWLARPVDDMHLDAVGNGVEAQDRVGRPVDAGDAGVVEADAFIQRPTRRLEDRAFHLIDQAVRIDRLPAIDGGDDAHQPDSAGLAFDFDLGSDRTIGGEILVARKCKTVAASGRQPCGMQPAKTSCGGG